ncbi:hypothetical protein K438DRAFT_1751056 [Mycena galopus ATCC 62051]|nr:hypothetical protein K438DRAFT_1751056 [Mycena galopus ATCC 62051]
MLVLPESSSPTRNAPGTCGPGVGESCVVSSMPFVCDTHFVGVDGAPEIVGAGRSVRFPDFHENRQWRLRERRESSSRVVDARRKGELRADRSKFNHCNRGINGKNDGSYMDRVNWTKVAIGPNLADEDVNAWKLKQDQDVEEAKKEIDLVICRHQPFSAFPGQNRLQLVNLVRLGRLRFEKEIGVAAFWKQALQLSWIRRDGISGSKSKRMFSAVRTAKLPDFYKTGSPHSPSHANGGIGPLICPALDRSLVPVVLSAGAIATPGPVPAG